MSSHQPRTLLLAQALGITTSGYLLGQNASLSLAAIPALMQAPSPLACKQWFTMLRASSLYAAPLGLLSGLSLLYTTYHTPRSTTTFRLNLAATLLFYSGVPISVFLLAPLDRQLEARMDVLEAYSLLKLAGGEGEGEGLFGEKRGGGEISVEEEASTKALLDRWGVLNLVRAAPVAAAFGCAVAAVLLR